MDGGLELAARTDALVVRTTSEALRGSTGTGNLEAARARVTRVRLGPEAAWRGIAMGSGTLEPTVELGVRHDGGDAETGLGADIGAGLAWTVPSRGIEAQMRARGLRTHADGGFRERGFAGSLAWDPRPDSDRGPSLTIGHAVGASAIGGTDALLEPDPSRALEKAGSHDGDAHRRRRRVLTDPPRMRHRVQHVFKSGAS